MKNFCLDLTENVLKTIKKGNDTINKKRKENISRAKSLLYMQKMI